MVQVKTYSQWQSNSEALKNLRQIFIENSIYVSRSLEEQEKAFQKWLSPYLQTHPNWLWGAFTEGKLVAYLSACPNSEKFLDVLSGFKSYPLFQEYFAKYPCHFHINTALSSQGKGVGSLLVKNLLSQLEKEKIMGCHIVTSPGEKNTAFYEKQGFNFRVEKDFAGRKLLFMARSMS